MIQEWIGYNQKWQVNQSNNKFTKAIIAVVIKNGQVIIFKYQIS